MRNAPFLKNILLAALAMLLLNGCGQKLGEEYTGEVNTAEGIVLTVEEDSVKPTEISYTIKNSSNQDLSYGQDYGLQKEKDGKWYEVIPENPVAVTLELLWLPSGNTDTHTTGWKDSYGELPAGHYRIVKHVSDNQQSYTLAGEFQIEE